MKLRTFIESYGQRNLAIKLGVPDSTIHNWRYARKLPRLEEMVRLHKLSGGRVSFKEIVEAVAEARGLL